MTTTTTTTTIMPPCSLAFLAIHVNNFSFFLSFSPSLLFLPLSFEHAFPPLLFLHLANLT